jgi:hypothetical protein
MAGHHPTSISYVMRRAPPSLSSSLRLPRSLEALLNLVGKIGIVGRKMKKHSFSQ